MYYFAYGMNTNIKGMSGRCPDAEDLGAAELPGYQMVFKYHCDVIKNPQTIADGVLWRISNSDLIALDALEGYPVYYDRTEVDVVHPELGTVQAMVYYMCNGAELEQPGEHYFQTVEKGYIEHGIKVKQLYDALDQI